MDRIDSRAIAGLVRIELAAAPSWDRRLWLSSAEVSTTYGISLRALRQMREAGVGPCWRPRGRQIFYNVTKFPRWLEKCQDHPVVEGHILQEYISERLVSFAEVCDAWRRSRPGGPPVQPCPRQRRRVVALSELYADARAWFSLRRGEVPAGLEPALHRLLSTQGYVEVRRRRRALGRTIRPRFFAGIWPRQRPLPEASEFFEPNGYGDPRFLPLPEFTSSREFASPPRGAKRG